VTEPNWRRSRVRLAWHLVVGEDAGLAALAEELAPRLRMAGLDPVAPRWLHLTLADATAEYPALGGFGPLTLRLGPLAALATAAVLPVEPAEELNALRVALGEETPFEPHVTLAYANCGTDAIALAHVLAESGDRVLEVVVDHVALLRLQRGERGYDWVVLERAPLGG
jgi:2'-5' RNA ligase